MAYFLGGKFGLALAFVNASVTAIWPPTGVALASVLMLGPRVWPAIFLGAFLTNVTTSGSIATSAAIAAGNTLEAVIAGLLIRRFAGGRAAFDRGQHIVSFVIASLAGCAVAATIGVTTLSLSGAASWADYGSIWLTWWMGDSAGAIVITPVIVLWHTTPRARWSARDRLELTALFAAVTLAGWLVFDVSAFPLGFICIPLCVLAGFRFGQREASLAACLLSLIAVWGSANGHGAFSQWPPNQALLLTASFMAVTTLICVTVAAAVSARRLAEDELRELNQDLERRVGERTAELEAALRNLEASETRLEEAQQIAGVGSWEWIAASQSREWSKELYRTFGYVPGECEPGLDAILARVHADDRGTFQGHIHRAAQCRQPFELELRVVRADGEVRTLHARGRGVYDDGGALVRMIGTTQDITERKRLEEHLQQARKMEAVGRLAGGIAHDFNNLLTAINGFNDFVLDDLGASHPRHDDLIEVRKASEQAAALTRQLLAFSRRQILQPHVIGLNELLADVERLLRRTISADIELVLTLDPALDAVRADPSQIQQVLLNLAINARDAMPGGGQLQFTTRMVMVDERLARQRAPMTPGRYVHLTVTDTGTGMSPETQERIFEPFFTTKERDRGTGLGLATVYGIVKQSGGFVWVTSELGAGTSFEIYLPAVNEAAELLQPISRPNLVVGGSETVLVAEDDHGVRRLAHRALTRHGYRVIEARDGEEALQMAMDDRRGDIQLLVTDVVMPGLSGHQLASRLTAERPDMRVLYISGYAEHATLKAALSDGAPLLAKPFLPVDLLQSVREILDQPVG